MTVDLSVIENLGLKMYVTIPPVISELIANAWDADAKCVDIQLPTGNIDHNSEIIIEDNGTGMAFEDITPKFLRIGRKKREEETDATPSGRKVMGRKGIGKLAPFGVAKIVEVETCKNYMVNKLRMNIDEILRAAKEKQQYFPEELKRNEGGTRKSFTRITLKTLTRTTPIDISSYRRSIAKRFSIIKGDFNVSINNEKITPDDWLKKEDMQYLWVYANTVVDSNHPDWKVNGWIGTNDSPLSEDQRGVVIMARGKLCQDTPFFFGASVGQKHSYAYITGILHAEFIDANEDLIATHRSSVVWESIPGICLIEWGKNEVRKIANEWQEKRRQKREEVIRDDPEFKEWLVNLPPAEAKLANKVIKAVTGDERIDDEKRKDLARFMKDSFEQQVFQEMIASLPDEPEDAKLIEIFAEWGFIEAKEILRVVKGRISTIEQFVKFVKEDAKEKPTIHNFFKEWPWILDPTWTQWNDEVHFSTLLREEFPDKNLDEPNRRIDFVCVGAGDTVHVVELKRPGHKINADDIEQLIRYVGFIKTRLGTKQENRYRDTSGYIIGGKISDDYHTQEKMNLLGGGRMYVRTYDSLIVIAQRLHDDFRKKIEECNRIKRSCLSEENVVTNG
jgi:hypothetical protein